MNHYNRLSESVSRTIANGWKNNDSNIIQTFSEVFEKQLLNQLSKFADKLNLICVPDDMTELPEYTYKNLFNLNKPYQLGLLLLTFKCYKLVVLNYRLVRLNGEDYPSISDIYLDNYNQEEFDNFALFINGLSEYEKVKDLKLEKIDVLSLLHVLNDRKLLNIHTNFFMFIDKCRFMNDPEDREDIIYRGIYRFYLSKSINAYDIYDFIHYLSDESIKELEEKFKEEISEESSEENFEEILELQELIDDYEVTINIYKKKSDKLRKVNQKLKNKIQKLDEEIQKKQELLNKYEIAIKRRISYLNKKDPQGKIIIE